MKYEKLSKGALGCMYTATAVGTIIGIGCLIGINVLWFLPSNIYMGKIASLSA